MRVVMVSNWLYRRGGLGMVMLDEATELGTRGQEVVPFTSGGGQVCPRPFCVSANGVAGYH